MQGFCEETCGLARSLTPRSDRKHQKETGVLEGVRQQGASVRRMVHGGRDIWRDER